MDPPVLTSRDTSESEAAAWLARRDGEDWTTADQSALDAWLESSTHHRVAYLRLAHAWERAERLKALTRPAQVGKVGGSRFAARVPLALGVGASAVAAAIAVFVGLSLESTPARHASSPGGQTIAARSPTVSAHSEYSTPVGGHKVVRLADGSRIDLNTDSQIAVDYTNLVRTVRLLRGEGYFEMRHDERRPVQVFAGDRRVTMVGTKFLVRLDTNRVIVTVTQGRVRVDDERGSADHAPAVLSADETMAASGESTIVVKATSEQIADQLSWRQGRLTFHQTPLADAAEEFNRYNAKKLVVSADIAQTRIGGSFDPTNLETFAALIHAGFGYKVVSEGDRISISE